MINLWIGQNASNNLEKRTEKMPQSKKIMKS